MGNRIVNAPRAGPAGGGICLAPPGRASAPASRAVPAGAPVPGPLRRTAIRLPFSPIAGCTAIRAPARPRLRRESRHQPPQDGACPVGMKRGGGQHRAGMRRHRAMHDRQPRQQRHRDQHGRTPAALRGRQHQGHHQHQPHFEEHRHAHHDAQHQHGPGNAALAEDLHQKAAQRRRAAGARQQAAQHRAQSKDDRDVAHQVPDARGERDRHLRQRHAGGNAQAQCGDHQRQRRMQAHADDQQEKQEYGSGHAGRQVPRGMSGGLNHRAIIGREHVRSSKLTVSVSSLDSFDEPPALMLATVFADRSTEPKYNRRLIPMELAKYLPPEAVKIVLVLFLSFLIGMEREEHKAMGGKYAFGGVRTFPLIGLIGYSLALVSGPQLIPLTIGFAVIGSFLLVSYWHKISSSAAGVTTEMVGTGHVSGRRAGLLRTFLGRDHHLRRQPAASRSQERSGKSRGAHRRHRNSYPVQVSAPHRGDSAGAASRGVQPLPHQSIQDVAGRGRHQHHLLRELRAAERPQSSGGDWCSRHCWGAPILPPRPRW